MTAKNIDFALGTMILAAGRSSRMGRPKMLLPWAGTTILGHLIWQWQKLGSQQIAVVNSPEKELTQELDRLRFPSDHRIENPKPERGMFSSIQCAASWDGWKKELTCWAIVLGDQPHLQERTLKELIDFARAHPRQVCQPERKGRPRHPVIMPATIFAKLKSSDCLDLKQFLKTESGEIALFKSDDPDLDWDIDYPSDYERLKRNLAPQE